MDEIGHVDPVTTPNSRENELERFKKDMKNVQNRLAQVERKLEPIDSNTNESVPQFSGETEVVTVLLGDEIPFSFLIFLKAFTMPINITGF